MISHQTNEKWCKFQTPWATKKIDIWQNPTHQVRSRATKSKKAPLANQESQPPNGLPSQFAHHIWHHGNGYLPEDTRSKLHVIKRYENCLSYIPLYKYNYTTTTLKGSLPRIMVACEDCFNRHTCILLCPPVQLRFIKRSKLSQPKPQIYEIYANKHDGLRASKYRHLYISGTSAFASTVSIVTYLFLGKKPSGWSQTTLACANSDQQRKTCPRSFTRSDAVLRHVASGATHISLKLERQTWHLQHVWKFWNSSAQ